MEKEKNISLGLNTKKWSLLNSLLSFLNDLFILLLFCCFYCFEIILTNRVFRSHEKGFVSLEIVLLIGELLNFIDFKSANFLNDILILFQEGQFLVDFFHVIELGSFLKNRRYVRFPYDKVSVLGFDHIVFCFSPVEDIIFLLVFYMPNSLFIPFVLNLEYLNFFLFLVLW
jgi:hypothetical protein